MIITTNKNFFLARCSERHYSLEEVSECIISKNDDQWTIDTDHPKYPKIPKNISQSIIDDSEGAGKELKILFDLEYPDVDNYNLDDLFYSLLE